MKQDYIHVCIDRLSRSLSRDGTDTACMSVQSLSLVNYLMYRRGETPGGKCKDEGSGRGAFEVISKLYLGS